MRLDCLSLLKMSSVKPELHSPPYKIVAREICAVVLIECPLDLSLLLPCITTGTSFRDTLPLIAIEKAGERLCDATFVTVVKTADLKDRHNLPNRLDGAWIRRILVQR